MRGKKTNQSARRHPKPQHLNIPLFPSFRIGATERPLELLLKPEPPPQFLQLLSYHPERQSQRWTQRASAGASARCLAEGGDFLPSPQSGSLGTGPARPRPTPSKLDRSIRTMGPIRRSTSRRRQRGGCRLLLACLWATSAPPDAEEAAAATEESASSQGSVPYDPPLSSAPPQHHFPHFTHALDPPTTAPSGAFADPAWASIAHHREARAGGDDTHTQLTGRGGRLV